MAEPVARQTSAFKAAFPYGVISLTSAVGGATLSLMAATTAMKIAGVVLALFGSYAFLAVLICGIAHSGNPKDFEKNLPKFLGSVMGSAIADICTKIALEVISGLINRALGRTGPSIRLSHI